MKTQGLRLLAVMAVLSVAGAAFGQGLYTESTTTGGPIGDRVETGKAYFMPKMVRMEHGEEGNFMIFRMDQQTIYDVNAAEKTYSATTFDEWEARMKGLNSKMDARRAEMQKRLESMPEEQRKMVEKMMGDRMAGGAGKEVKTEVTKTGEKKSVSGYSCSKYSITKDGKETIAVWATPDIRGFESMKKDYAEFARRFSSISMPGAKSLAEAILQIQGFPMEMDHADGIKMVVTKAEPKTIPVSMFEVPAGYTKVKNKLMEADEQQKGE